jgi:hypothetical protein
MKKIIWVLMTAAAATTFSCGDGTNRSSERDDDATDADNTEQVEPDTTATDMESNMESDTTSTWDRDRESISDTTQRR